MQKTYWWRCAAVLLSSAGAIVGYALFYPYRYGLCSSLKAGCIFSFLKKTFAEPLVLLSLSLLAVSFFLFFIRDDVFLKWFRFAVLWFIVAAVFIFLAPVSSGGWGANLNPTKESVSIWMSSLFVIVSLAKIIWDTRKSKAVL